MDFKFNVDNLLWSNINLVTATNLPRDKEKVAQLAEIINEMGQASAIAQGLKTPVTTFSKLLDNSSQQLYIMKCNPLIPKNQPPTTFLQQRQQLLSEHKAVPQQAKFYPFSDTVRGFGSTKLQHLTVRALMTNNGTDLPQEIFGPGLLQSRKFQRTSSNSSHIVGILKIGRKSLYMADEKGRTRLVQPICILDFYVHESYQRKGFGRQLFNHVLEIQNSKPGNFAYDRPSNKLLNFLDKNYALRQILPQSNNFVIYKQYQLTEKFDMDDAMGLVGPYHKFRTTQHKTSTEPLEKQEISGLEEPAAIVPVESVTEGEAMSKSLQDLGRNSNSALSTQSSISDQIQQTASVDAPYSLPSNVEASVQIINSIS